MTLAGCLELEQEELRRWQIDFDAVEERRRGVVERGRSQAQR